MAETQQDYQDKSRDRKLGDEWLDWKGSNDSRESEIDENLRTFFLLALGIIFIFFTLLPVAWYMIKPRIFQLNHFISALIEWFVTGLAFICLILLPRCGT